MFFKLRGRLNLPMRVIFFDLKKDHTDTLLTVIEVLKKGGVIVYPTDTVYGLGANACDYKAVEQIFKIKKRPLTKPLPIIARNINWVKELAYIPPKLEKILVKIWPGSVTIILPKKDIIPSVVTASRKNVGIRIPDSEFTDKLMGKFGYPLTATSANISGEEGSRDPKKIIEAFQDQLWKPDLILDAGILPKSLPSTILDLSTIQPKILRVGPTKPAQLMEILGLDKKTYPKRS